jgi:hypothetical protein
MKFPINPNTKHQQATQMFADRTQNGNAIYAMLQADLMRMPEWKEKRKRDRKRKLA